MITSKQSKAARAILGWSLDDLAKHSGVARNAITQFENENIGTRQKTIETIEETFSAANIEFFGLTGVASKEDGVELFKGPDCLKKLWQSIYHTFEGEGGEVLLSNIDDQRGVDFCGADLFEHAKNMKERNITDRVLSCEGDSFFLTDNRAYRWIPKENFDSSKATFVYADKLAYFIWSKSIVILVHSKEASDAERERFEAMWAEARKPESEENPSKAA